MAFLMRELAHRSKNLLAVVKGMATQSARQSENIEQFQWHFNRRIQGLANSHDLLVRQNWKGAYLNDLIHGQLQVFVDDLGSRVCINGPSVFLESEAVQSLGLALHELATNACKYGALSNTEGIIRISWRLDREVANGGRLSLSWQELDGPPVATPTRSGFGRMVIERMVGQVLGGSVALEFTPRGLICQLQIPGTYLDVATSTREESSGEWQTLQH
jgi:two-component sensor histidine kinase